MADTLPDTECGAEGLDTPPRKCPNASCKKHKNYTLGQDSLGLAAQFSEFMDLARHGVQGGENSSYGICDLELGCLDSNLLKLMT